MMTQSLTLLAGIMTIYLTGSYLLQGLKHTTVEVYTQIGSFELTESNVYPLLIKLFGAVLLLLAPVIIVIMVTGILSHIVQDKGRIDFQWGRLEFKPDKLNPLNGVKRLFNKDALIEILKSLLKIFVIGWIAYQVIRDELQNIALLSESDILGILAYTGHVAFKIVTQIGRAHV